MKNIWVISDTPEYAYELLSKVAKVGEQVTVFVNGDQKVAEECFRYGANTVKLLPIQANTTWEQYSKVIVNEGRDVLPDLIVVAATRRGKTVAALLAGYLDIPCVTESKGIEIEGNKVSFSRTIFGGLAEKELEVVDKPVVVSITPGTFAKEKADNPTNGEVAILELIGEDNVAVIERKDREVSSVNLNEADIVVGVGRGFGKKENLKYAEELARILGGEIGCSRPVTEDYRWFPEERYIGISGAVIKPNLYIAAGISGQIQHVYGVREAKTIVAIDKNENAPIFKVADYYIVGDLQEVLPELIAAVK